MSWRIWLALAVTAGFSALTLMLVDLSALPEAFAAIRLREWLLAVPLFVFAHILRGLRWAVFLEPLASPPPVRVVSYTIVGMWINDVIPLRAGELYRVWLLKSREGVSLRAGLASVIVERTVDGLFVVGLLALAMWWLELSDPRLMAARSAGILLFGVLLGFLILAAFAPGRVTRLGQVLAHRLPGRAGQALERTLAQGLEALSVLRRARLVAGALVYSVLLWGILALFYFLMMRALEIPASPAGAMLLLSVVSLSVLVPAVPSNVGVYHFACMGALVLLGTPEATGLALAVLLHLTEVLVTLVMGAGLMLTLGFSSPARERRRALSLTAEDGT